MITAEQARGLLKVSAQRYSEEVFKKIEDAAMEDDNYITVERKWKVEGLVLDQLRGGGFDVTLSEERLYIKW